MFDVDGMEEEDRYRPRIRSAGDEHGLPAAGLGSSDNVRSSRHLRNTAQLQPCLSHTKFTLYLYNNCFYRYTCICSMYLPQIIIY